MVAECQPRKLLVVDDEPLVRQTLRLCLQDEYEVTTVASGEEAIEASLREPFPVVILDLCMEGLSGLETLKRLKKIRAVQNVIILTAYESTESAISALNFGAFNYLTKPFERGRLKQVVSRGFDAYDQQSLRKQEMQQRLMSVHDTFFSLMCHEFNTPLHVILGYADLLSQCLKDPEHLSWAREIHQSGDYLHDILMEVIDYIAASHLATAGIESEFRAAELLEPMVDTFRETGVDVQLDTDFAQGVTMVGPSKSIFLIARKLVRMASHQSRNIRVEVRIEAGARAGSDARLSIEVTGTGARVQPGRQSELERLFEPYRFHPDDAAGSRSSLGLELATCRKIAEYAHGSVDSIFSSNGEIGLMAEIPVTLIRSRHS
jgi:CheY-like chemotaxis protein